MTYHSQKQNAVRKRNTFILNCVLMFILTMVLGFYFGIRVFALPLPEAWWPFKALVLGLIAPLDLFFKLVMPLLPPAVQGVFPAMPVSLFLHLITQKPLADFATYKGAIEWLTFLAIPFWQAFLAMSYYCAWYLKESLSLQDVREAITEYKAIASDDAPKRLTPVSVRENQHQSASQGNQQNEAHIRGRLSDSKELTQKAPSVQKYTQQDWEHYKHKEGELMVRDMIHQLRQENLNLLSQKNNLQSTFSQYFSPSVLKYLEQNKQSFSALQNQHHTISVLFCDLRGFSSYSQTVSSDELMLYLGEYFEIASYAILHKYDGVISKLMGDGFMAYWGFPMGNADHAHSATLAAMTILKEVQFRNELKPMLKPIEVGIGIATGDVVVGNVGSMDFKDFTLIGNPVNFAARLQETNKELGTGMLISQATYDSLNGRIPCQAFENTTVRGWQKLETVYRPL